MQQFNPTPQNEEEASTSKPVEIPITPVNRKMEPCNLPPLNTTIDIPIEVDKGFSTLNQLQVLTAAGEFISPTTATPDIRPRKLP